MVGYIRDTWDFGDTLEVEEKHTGKYGAPGMGRKKRGKATPEDIRRQNQKNREKTVRRLIKWNFGLRDYWITITYQKGDRPGYEEMQKDIQNLLKKVKRRYQKAGKELKYIYRLGIGKKGGPHIHILVNRIQNAETGTDLIFSECWDKGHLNFRHTYEAGDYAQLAEYIVKPREEWEPEGLKRYHPSRNLVRKEPERKEIRRRTLVDKYGIAKPVIPRKGYYVDPESLRWGFNQVTGFFYRHYTLVKLDRRI